MIPLRVAQVATVLAAQVHPGTEAPADLGRTVTDVTTDSRAVGPGSLFVALEGERVDGHAFVAGAFAQGAVAVLVAHVVDGAGGPQLVVPDPLLALGRLARHVVDRLRGPDGLRVVGITGSQGKTSTKDLLGAVLAAAGPTVAPAGNLNNELGVPLTVLQVEGSGSASEGNPAGGVGGRPSSGQGSGSASEGNPAGGVGGRPSSGQGSGSASEGNPAGGVGGRPPSGQGTSFLVAEMGARGIGHIAYLCGIAPPDVAVVLNVGHAHVGEFGGREAIAQAKGELVEAVGEDGIAVLNASDPRVWAMRSRTRARVLPFGVEQAVDGPDGVWAEDLVGDDRGRYTFTLRVRSAGEERSAHVALRGTGRHQVANATAAAAAAVALGLDLELVAGALSAAEPASRWRMEVHDRADGVRVVNDSYNANPASMAAAVETLAELGRGRGRTWAVVGDMLELGVEAPALHAELAAQLAAAEVDEVVALGEFAPLLVAGQPGRARIAQDTAQASAWVRADVAPGDVVLVKASRGLALDVVADDILRAPDPERDADAEAGGRA
ncbi:MAG: UDP-N-acetylmuramoyl-tripeptide--D-alanyl-D-alanine ligase [Janthinobacterium lividum]